MEKSASNNPASFHGLIAAAGIGSRLGGDVPKQYLSIGGKPILRRTIETFLACPGLQSLHVIINPEHKRLYEEVTQGLDLSPPVSGGNSRKESIYLGLESLSNLKSEEKILIHDGARPFVTVDNILNIVNVLDQAQAATLSIPVADTLYRDNTGAYINREGLNAIQTPQGFHYGLIKRAHETYGEEDYTDDTSLVAALGESITLVEGRRANIKITTQEDLHLAERLCESRKMTTRTGTGYDVHAFANEESSSIRLCGIDIPYNRRLSGHSDADVGLHALTDALLGALALGDIGEHFPPSDDKWKNKDSSFFLEEIVKLLKQKKGSITNLDLTLICEQPKIGPHRVEMQNRIAEICDLPSGTVSVKATTSEGLGFTGRGEGIAAQAIATIELPAE